jgi:hypothetical protein
MSISRFFANPVRLNLKKIEQILSTIAMKNQLSLLV